MNFAPLAGVLALLSGCASSPSSTAIPAHTMLLEGGMYQTSGYGVSQDESEKAASYNTNDTCGRQKKVAVISKKDSRYQGTIGEDLNKTVTMVSALIKSTTGKDYGSTSTDKDYKTTLSFRCQ